MKLYRFVNVGNQIHLIVQGYSRKHVQAFLRDVTGTLAIAITGARKGQALGHRFWTQLAFSRVISWGREFRRIFAATDFLSAAERTIAAIVTVDPIPKVT